MDALMLWGNNFIVALQQAWPGLGGVMLAFSFLGNEEFFLLFMPALYWCWDAGLGLRLAVLLVSGNAVTALGKLAFHLPRPYWVDSRVQALSNEASYGLPSGHALVATSVWGGLAAYLKQPRAWLGAVTVIALISLSRVYLGVHFPTDVVAGWLVGAALLWAFTRWGAALAARLRVMRLWMLISLALAVSLIYLVLTSGLLLVNLITPDPAQWGTQAALATNTPVGEAAISPRAPETPVTIAGLMFGLGTSLALIAHTAQARFNARRGTGLQRALRFGIGIVGVLVIWLGLRALFPVGGDVVALTLRFVRYALTIVWALYAAPIVFVRFKLAELDL